MKIGIMGAMLQEVKHIKDLMEVTDTTSIADREYICGKIGEIDIVLVFSRWGKVAATSTATTLINTFNIDFLLFTGVAGAVDLDLNVGDIVIGDGLYQHDMDARPIFPRFQIPLTDNVVFEPKAEHVALAKDSAELFLKNMNERISKSSIDKFSLFKPTVYVGVIASGDKFVSDPLSHDSLKLDGRKVLAVEMEGAAVAQVCTEHKKPYLVIRTISDKANHSAQVDFQAFVEEVASHYSTGIALDLVTKLQ